jgi:hypothetical protein
MLVGAGHFRPPVATGGLACLLGRTDHHDVDYTWL